MRKLNEQQNQFVEEYVKNGFNGTDAYKAAYPNAQDATARVEACRFLKDERIQEAIDIEEGTYKSLARTMKLGKKDILKKIKSILVDADPKSQIAAINTLFKVTGDLAPEKKQIEFDDKSNIDLSKLKTKEDLEKAKAALLKEL